MRVSQSPLGHPDNAGLEPCRPHGLAAAVDWARIGLAVAGLGAHADTSLANPQGAPPSFAASSTMQYHDTALSRDLLLRQRQFVEAGDCLSHVFQWTVDGEVRHKAAVFSGRDGDRPIDDETLFAIWSMTKPVTAMAVMMLWEEGAFALDDSVTGVLPALAGARVMAPGGGIQPLVRPITYKDLLLHRSGIAGYDGSFHDDGTWKRVMELDHLDDLIPLLLSQPLAHQPGERYTYGLSHAVLGLLVQKHSGRTLAEFFQTRIFEPLGMTRTRFFLTTEDRRRFQPLFVKEGDGFRPGTPSEDELPYAPNSKLFLGGEGLVSTLEDFSRFCQMLADEGRAPDGRSLLRAETLREMLKDQLGELPGYGGTQAGRVLGYGFEILQDPARAGSAAPAGVYGWSGYHSTHFWIDPSLRAHGLFLTRRYPYHEGPRNALQAVIYAPR